MSRRQIKVGKLGKLPSAIHADTATNAANAAALGGFPASAFAPAARLFNIGVVKVSGATALGHTVAVMTSAPFKVTFTCTDNGGAALPPRLTPARPRISPTERQPPRRPKTSS